MGLYDNATDIIVHGAAILHASRNMDASELAYPNTQMYLYRDSKLQVMFFGHFRYGSSSVYHSGSGNFELC